jgi:ABC-type multidrug transport system permease subunit
MIANIVVELFYQVILGVLVFLCYYYATFGYTATNLVTTKARLTVDRIQSSDRQVLVLLFCIEIFIFASTFAQMIIVALPDAHTAGAFATLLFSMTMIFNGYGEIV